ncbi:MAG: CbiX/SirB N-terminal domain-containing protein [Nitrospirota bacterium]
MTREIPELIEKARKQHPGIDIIVTEYVGAHPMMAKIVEELVGRSNAECGIEKHHDIVLHPWLSVSIRGK